MIEGNCSVAAATEAECERMACAAACSGVVDVSAAVRFPAGSAFVAGRLTWAVCLWRLAGLLISTSLAAQASALPAAT